MTSERSVTHLGFVHLCETPEEVSEKTLCAYFLGETVGKGLEACCLDELPLTMMTYQHGERHVDWLSKGIKPLNEEVEHLLDEIKDSLSDVNYRLCGVDRKDFRNAEKEG